MMCWSVRYDVLVCAAGVLEMARTGRVAMVRDSGVNTPFLEKMVTQRVW